MASSRKPRTTAKKKAEADKPQDDKIETVDLVEPEVQEQKSEDRKDESTEDADKSDDAKPIEEEAAVEADQPTSAESLPEAEPEQEQPTPEEQPAPEETPKEAVPEKRGGFVPMLLGGAATAAIGFGVAQFVDLPLGQNPSADIEAALDAQTARFSEIENAVAAALDDSAIMSQISNLQATVEAEQAATTQGLDDLTSKLAEIDVRLTEVEKLPVSGSTASSAAVAAYERELQALREMFEAQSAEIQTIASTAAAQVESAERLAKEAAVQAAVSRIEAALDSGGPFAEALNDLKSVGNIEIPAELGAVATAGAPTQMGLQEQFPDAARAALQASIQLGVEDGTTSRLTAFLRTQLGARSLEPREGDDADAILSRAEAALRDGDIETSLSEIAALPNVGQDALANWVANAMARQSALAAVEKLTESIGSN
ncbi:hypothetical protein [Pseudohalocynthiibacter sp. F2068]|uniref:COG4223 family protein n=1 Tax=Pseudohalocynthiibacter sp. F2068 TaxID=2926418 RepID=UPI001FF2D88F|nr:hypothetical protein [Pseudohalocynthiibacter sp. F2068]MCK0102893.1 hypothetical protein [Pseudohalocynthiibacter sp. F2068]